MTQHGERVFSSLATVSFLGLFGWQKTCSFESFETGLMAAMNTSRVWGKKASINPREAKVLSGRK